LQRRLIENLVNAAEEYRLIVGILPTGYGKSSIVLRHWNRLKQLGRYIHILPLRAIVEDLAFKTTKITELTDYTSYQAHTHIKDLPKSPLLASTYVITTYDSFSLNALGIPIAELLKNKWHSDLAVALALGANLILDEVHIVIAPDTAEDREKDSFYRIFATLTTIISKSLCLDNKVFLLTATLHPQILNGIIRLSTAKIADDKPCYILVYAQEDHPYVVNLKEYEDLKRKCDIEADVDEEFEKLFPEDGFRIEVAKLGVDEILKKVAELAESKRRVAIFVNTVRRAVEIFEKLENYIDNKPILLLHSRMPPESREYITRLLRDLNSYILIATQVVEAGVDVSFDAAISSAASPSSLIQRIGRVCRYGWRPDSDCYFMVNKDADGVGVIYDENLVKNTIEYIEKHKKLSEGWRWRIPDKEKEPIDYLTLVMSHRIGVGSIENYVFEYQRDINSLNELSRKEPRNALKILDSLKALVRDSPLLTMIFIDRGYIDKMFKNPIQVSSNEVNDLVSRYSISADLELLERAWHRNDLHRYDGDNAVFVVQIRWRDSIYLLGLPIEFSSIKNKPFTTMVKVINEAREYIRSYAKERLDIDEEERITIDILGIATDKTKLLAKTIRIKIFSYG